MSWMFGRVAKAWAKEGRSMVWGFLGFMFGGEVWVLMGGGQFFEGGKFGLGLGP